MSEEETQQSEAPVEETNTETPQNETLDDVLQEYSVDEAAQQFNAQPAQQERAQQPQEDYSYDYFDDSNQDSALMKQVEQTLSKVSSLERKLVEKEAEADIGKAVDRMSQHIDGIDPDVARSYLEGMARKDARLMNLWNNRDSNPKAWEKAIDATGRQLAEKWTIKQDPQLTENQRAAKQSQQSMAATHKPVDEMPSTNEEIDALIRAAKADGY